MWFTVDMRSFTRLQQYFHGNSRHDPPELNYFVKIKTETIASVFNFIL